MVNREQILQELYDTQFVQRYTMEKCKQRDYYDDYLGEVWLIICQIPEERLVKLYEEGDGINGVRRFVAGIICRTVASQTTEPYYRLIKRDCRNLAIKMNNDKRLTFNEEEGWI